MTPDRSAMIAILLLNGWQPCYFNEKSMLFCGSRAMYASGMRVWRFGVNAYDMQFVAPGEWSAFGDGTLAAFVAEIER